MIKKAVLLAIILVALSLGSAFAIQIDSLASKQGPTGTGLPVNVFVNPGGLGDVLIYGYYNVRDNNETIFTVTNTASVGARVRIRFREAATQTATSSTDPMVAEGCDNGSQEVLDFDICLSKNDMWTGQIVSDSNGAGRLFSTDIDTFVQTSPAGPSNPNPAVIFPTAYPSGAEFKFGSNNTISSITADQTREGYFEVIAERQLSDQCGGSGQPKCTCGDLLDVEPDGVTAIPVDSLSSPNEGLGVGNVLMGHTYIVNLSTSSTFAYAATALGDFNFNDITNNLTFNRPNLKADNGDTPGSIGSVNYALTKSNLMSIYDVESQFNGKTQLIVNFPTKWATHFDYFEEGGECDLGPLGSSVEETGDDIFDNPRVKVMVYDDKEKSPQSSCEFSPCPLGTDVTLPNEVNVIDINGSGIFTSDGLVAVATSFDFGWINIDLTNANTGVPTPLHLTACDATDFPLACTTDGSGSAPDAAVTHGLPAIGYAVMNFAGGNFSGLIPLQYSTQIDPEGN